MIMLVYFVTVLNSFSFFERFNYERFKARLCGLVTMMILVIVMETDMM